MTKSTGRLDSREVTVVATLAGWLKESLDDPGPFRLRSLGGGNSNETAIVAGRRARAILRRPPQAAVSATAHNLEREYRILAALSDQQVPTPRAIAYTADEAVAPMPCLLMELVDGHPLAQDWPAGWRVGPNAIGEAGRSAVDALAQLHGVDWQAVGLDGFGRPEGYLRRQVSRWSAQYEQNQVRELPLFEQLSGWLEANRPPDAAPAILHGDFHLDNALFRLEGGVHVSAIIDWELSTIGDPLVDLGLLLAFWGSERPEPAAMPRVQALSRSPHAPSRRELADRYSERSGRDTSALPFYMALAFFKLAAIVEGAYGNFLAGRVDSDYARALADDVPRLLAEAALFTELL